MQLKSKTSKTIKFFIDEFIPPIIRDSGWFYKPIINLWNRKMDVDFKVKALKMSDEEFKAAYERLVPMRATDNTPETIEFVLNHIKGEKILEVGCGNGDVSYLCAKKGHTVVASDLAEGNLIELEKRFNLKGYKISTEVADIESLPFENKSFDTSICLHTLEHVRNLSRAISELKRVTKKRIIIIVPRQRYFRYTADYHLNFFGNPEQLQLAIGLEKSVCITKDFCLCYYGDLA